MPRPTAARRRAGAAMLAVPLGRLRFSHPCDGARSGRCTLRRSLEHGKAHENPTDNPLPHQHAAQGWLALAIFALVAWVGVPMAHLMLPESSPFSVSAYTVT